MYISTGVIVYYFSASPMELKQDNQLNVLPGSFLLTLSIYRHGCPEGKELLGEKNECQGQGRTLKDSVDSSKLSYPHCSRKTCHSSPKMALQSSPFCITNKEADLAVRDEKVLSQLRIS